ncbi:MAG: hypothetical protein IJ679_07565 [Lachnospiraceae bacterium]|nr:hypothetical protein [Lachnospiraceae bacterium]
MEYIIGKYDSDEKNLEKTVEKLLIYRGAMNLVSFEKDETKKMEARAVAVALSFAVMNPEIAPVLQQGIIAAWVYIESVMDVRTLLSGGKIPIIKTSAEWTSGILSLPACLKVEAKAKTSASGMDYQGCLCAMLTMVSEKNAGLRALDLIENELRLYPDYRNIRMDSVLYCASAELPFSGAPTFGSMVTIAQPPDAYTFLQKAEMSYLE